MERSIVGLAAKTLRLVISEPWDLGERTLVGTVVKSQSEPTERLLLELQEPLDFAGSTYRGLLISPRHEGHPLSRVAAGDAVPCNAFGVVTPAAEVRDLTGALSWRGGGLILIGSLSTG
jgi:hypothetical protein